MMNKDLQYYMKLPYKVVITPPSEDDDRWLAYFPELEGCSTHANSWDELEQQISDAKESWLELSLELGDEIPEPIPV